MNDDSPDRSMITQQKVNLGKLQRARELRQMMTPAEKLLWDSLRARRLEEIHFRRQQTIDGYIVDFFCHSANLAIEVDGDVHQDRAEYDRERDAALSELGVTVIRFSNQDLLEN